MKKYFVIGNPIDHSLSPKLHNHWLKENKIDAVYDKKKIDENDLENIITKLKKKQINLINIDYKTKKAFENISSKSNKYIENCFNLAIKLLRTGLSNKFINGPISKKHFLKKIFQTFHLLVQKLENLLENLV